MKHKISDYFLYLGARGFFRWMSDEQYLRTAYRLVFHKKLNLDNPMTFNEKLQWLKLHNRKKEYVMMVDKYRVRDYIAKMIGEEYLIPLLGVWDRPEDIDIEKLPNQFVLKCNHDSGSVIVCRDKSKFDFEVAKRKLKKKMKRGTFYYGREWPYKYVKPCIIAEQYMEDDSNKEIQDYKVHNFDGVSKVILVCKDRFKQTGLTEDFFSDEWEHLDIKRINHPNSDSEIKKPESLSLMLELSERLSKGHPFLRTDFYEVNGKIYFGELTFYPASGLSPESFDKSLGEMLELPMGGVALVNKNVILHLHEAEVTNGLKDYKFFCFKGKCSFFKIDYDRFISHSANYYSTQGELLSFGEMACPPNGLKTVEMPKALTEMIALAEKISNGTDFMRVDFYESCSRVFFGEITFFPASGFGAFTPEIADRKIGELINIP